MHRHRNSKLLVVRGLYSAASGLRSSRTRTRFSSADTVALPWARRECTDRARNRVGRGTDHYFRGRNWLSSARSTRRMSANDHPQRAFGVILICRGLGSLIYAKLDLRLYRPWAEVLDGRWKFPGAEPEN